MPLIDNLARKLSSWRSLLLSRGERLALVRHVLTAMPVHIMLAMALCPTILKLANRIIRDFLWHSCKDARSGSYPINRKKVCWPRQLGGLGIRDLQRTGIALRTRWLWLQATDSTRPWSHLHLPAASDVRQIFRASTSWTLGDGNKCLFWIDSWLDGSSIAEIAPALVALVPKRRRSR